MNHMPRRRDDGKDGDPVDEQRLSPHRNPDGGIHRATDAAHDIGTVAQVGRRADRAQGDKHDQPDQRATPMVAMASRLVIMDPSCRAVCASCSFDPAAPLSPIHRTVANGSQT